MTTEPANAAPEIAAAELALGVLDGGERAAALRRMIAEPDFAREVERWRDHFALLFVGVGEASAPDGILQRVEQQIGRAEDIPLSARSRGNPWKPAAIAASVAALAMTAVAFRPAGVAPATVASAPMVAAMALTGTNASQPALYDAKAGMVKMPGPMPIPAGRSAQLWAITGNEDPKPLGTFHATGPGTYEAEAKMGVVIPAGTKLAITLEPMGGSPTGKPTGAMIASGMLIRV